MNAVTAQSNGLLAQIRKEMGLDREPEPEPEKPVKPCGRPPSRINKFRSKRKVDPARAPLPGEIQLKEWIANKAAAEGKTKGAIWNRYCEGKYQLKVRKVTRWLQYVQV